MNNITQTERTEFGFKRTRCGCPECSAFCKVMPGYLVPNDLPRICGPLMEPDVIVTYLAASPGAVVMMSGQIMRVATIVPGRDPEHGGCIFLASDGKCKIYEDAPYGCAFADTHLSREEGMCRSIAGIEAILRSSVYPHVWRLLYTAGKRAPGPEETRPMLGRK